MLLVAAVFLVANPATRAGSFFAAPFVVPAARQPIPDALTTDVARTGIWSMLGTDSTSTLRAGRVGLDRRFVVPGGWRVTDARLELDAGVVGKSAAGLAVSVTVNGDVIHHVPLSDLGSVDAPSPGIVRVALPADLLSAGNNYVAVDLVGGEPADGFGVVIGPRTQLVVDLSPALIHGIEDIGLALAPLGDEPRALTLVLPPDAGAALLNAAATIAFLSARSEGPNPRWRVVTNIGEVTPGVGPVVVLARADDALASGLGLSSDREAAGAVSQPGWAGGEPVLVLAGRSDGAIATLADALADPSAPLAIRRGVAFVETPLKRELTPDMPLRSLADLGYVDRTVGCGGTLMVLVDVAAHRAASRASFRLRGRTHLVPGSEILVKLNGHNQQLITPTGGSQTLDVTVPLDPADMRPGRNSLRVDVGGACAATNIGSLLIDDESTVSVERSPAPFRARLDDLPGHFAAEPDLAELTVVLPDLPTVNDLAGALDLVSSLGGSTSRYAPRLSVPPLVDDRMRAGHLVLLGEHNRQPLLNLFGERLPISGLRLDNPATLLLEDPESPVTTNIGVVQMIRSPYEAEHILFVVTGTSLSGYRSALGAVVDPDVAATMVGSAALVTVRPDGSLEVDGVVRGELPASASRSGFSQLVDAVPVPVLVPTLVVGGICMAVLSYRVRRRYPAG